MYVRWWGGGGVARDLYSGGCSIDRLEEFMNRKFLRVADRLRGMMDTLEGIEAQLAIIRRVLAEGGGGE